MLSLCGTFPNFDWSGFSFIWKILCQPILQFLLTWTNSSLCKEFLMRFTQTNSGLLAFWVLFHFVCFPRASVLYFLFIIQIHSPPSILLCAMRSRSSSIGSLAFWLLVGWLPKGKHRRELGGEEGSKAEIIISPNLHPLSLYWLPWSGTLLPMATLSQGLKPPPCCHFRSRGRNISSFC